GSGGGGSSGETKRTCVDCGTFRTPLWRGGPAGPKVRSRKPQTSSNLLDHWFIGSAQRDREIASEYDQMIYSQ
ncbi:unnamed protein product, partial [Thlaspi arvense]